MTEIEKALLILFLFTMVFAFGCLQICLSKLWRKYVEKETPAIQHSPEFLADKVILFNYSFASRRRDVIQDTFAPLPMPDDVRDAWRRCVDIIVEGREQTDELELNSFISDMSPIVGLLNTPSSTVLDIPSFVRQGNWEEKDHERFTQLCELYDKVKKQNTKLKVKCPGCKRSLKGISEAMIGNTAMCPKCKTEITIEKNGNKTKSRFEK